MERGIWRTVAGVVGDLKTVKAVDSATALANNPGWVIDNSQSQSVGLEAHMFEPEAMQNIVSATGSNGDYVPFDLSAALGNIGLTTADHVFLQLEVGFPSQGFRNQGSYDAWLSVASTTQAVNAVTAAHAHASATINDSDSSAYDTNMTAVKLDSNSIYYSLYWTHTGGSFNGVNGKIWLAGVMYNPLLHPNTPTLFGIRKT
jgi:hypothetical protein